MIRLTKRAVAPSSLARGAAARTADEAAYNANQVGYRAGTVKFTFYKSIYGTNTVKKALKADQHDKCAFCEAIFDANAAGDVEHFRPKGAVDTGDGRIYPGYYWLAYVWANLSYACTDCNEYRKRDRFPLKVEANRARDHHGNVAGEAPLLLDPYGPADPRDHIRFRGEAPIGLTPEGKESIKTLRIDRTTLARDRLEYLHTITLLYDSLRSVRAKANPDPGDPVLIARLEAKLDAVVQPNAKFSAATVDHLAALAAGRNYLKDVEPA